MCSFSRTRSTVEKVRCFCLNVPRLPKNTDAFSHLHRVHCMLTAGYNEEIAATFLQVCLPLLQLAAAEYVCNVMLDFFPVETQITGFAIQHATQITLACDQFRESAIKTGLEEWPDVTQTAQVFLNRLTKNLNALATTTKRGGNFRTTFTGVVLDRSHESVNPVGRELDNDCNLLQRLLDLRVCTTDNLKLVYPFLSTTQARVLHVLHQRIRISFLPPTLMQEQVEVHACVQILSLSLHVKLATWIANIVSLTNTNTRISGTGEYLRRFVRAHAHSKDSACVHAVRPAW